MKTLLLLSSFLFLFAGCATKPPAATTYYDPVTGARTDLSENLLPSPATPREVVWLNMYGDSRTRRRHNYYFEVKYMAPSEAGYLEIPPGETLTIIADGKPLKLDGGGSLNRRRTYRKDFVTETALYDVSKADLQNLAMAKSIKVQVRGNKGLVERDFGAENYENLKAFVTRAAL